LSLKEACSQKTRRAGWVKADPPYYLGTLRIPALAGMRGGRGRGGRRFIAWGLGVEPLVPPAPGQQVVRANRKEEA